jgi:N-acetylmuramic acid 6-phosphate etherase
LQTEARNPASTNLDELTPLQLVRLMNAEDARVIPAVASQAEAIAKAVEIIADRLRAGGRLIYVGAGTSGRLGVLDATECPPTFNAPLGQVVGVIAGGPPALTQSVEGAEDHPEFADRDLRSLGLGPKDVLVGIATSGRTPYVLGAIAHAHRLGAYTIGLSCNTDAELIGLVDLALTVVVGPEILSGSTRLKGGTATKLVLNMLTTGAMVRLGKTFGNLMVDLRATNDKLRARTNRIVRQLTGLTREEADALLERCGRELKTALVSHLAAITPEEARMRLQAADGQVRRSLSQTPTPTVATDLYLGIDGGGTHTVALLACADASARGGWRLLGRGEAGPSNLQAVGVGSALDALDAAVSRAFAAAGLGRCPAAGACLGLAGAGRSHDQEVIAEWADRVKLAEAVQVIGDAPLLLAAGTPDGWGAALIAGTGSMAFVRDCVGRTARAGGWGHLLGDEGSGYALVVSALQACARAADGRGPATALVECFLTRLGLARPQDLIGAVYRGGLDRTGLAALAPIVFEAAHAGDEVAAGIISLGAEQLAATVAAAARQVKLDDAPLPLALAGGLLLNSPGYSEKVLAILASHGQRAEPVTPVREPAEGAVRLALAKAAKPMT